MQEAFISTLRERRAQIRARWEAFLRIEKVNTPLANPDTLVYLFDQTLDEVFAALKDPPAPRQSAPPAGACEKNPLFAYFVAGEQALLEALVLAQAGSRNLDPKERDADVAHLRHVMHKIARRDIGSLEGVFHSRKPSAAAGH
jgi:hypothetical protein